MEVTNDFRAEESPADPTPEDTISRLELTRYMRNQLLRDSDVMSMAQSIELRVPFLDHRLVEDVLSLPQAVKRNASTPKAIACACAMVL